MEELEQAVRERNAKLRLFLYLKELKGGEMILTEKEIDNLRNDYIASSSVHGCRISFCDFVAKAQLKKMVEWVNNNSEYDIIARRSVRIILEEDWQALLKEVEELT